MATLCRQTADHSPEPTFLLPWKNHSYLLSPGGTGSYRAVLPRNSEAGKRAQRWADAQMPGATGTEVRCLISCFTLCLSLKKIRLSDTKPRVNTQKTEKTFEARDAKLGGCRPEGVQGRPHVTRGEKSPQPTRQHPHRANGLLDYCKVKYVHCLKGTEGIWGVGVGVAVICILLWEAGVASGLHLTPSPQSIHGTSNSLPRPQTFTLGMKFESSFLPHHTADISPLSNNNLVIHVFIESRKILINHRSLRTGSVRKGGAVSSEKG